MLSTMGGMNVEEIAEKDPDALVRRHVEPAEGFGAAAGRAARLGAGRSRGRLGEKTAEVLVKLYEAFNETTRP